MRLRVRTKRSARYARAFAIGGGRAKRRRSSGDRSVMGRCCVRRTQAGTRPEKRGRDTANVTPTRRRTINRAATPSNTADTTRHSSVSRREAAACSGSIRSPSANHKQVAPRSAGSAGSRWPMRAANTLPSASRPAPPQATAASATPIPREPNRPSCRSRPLYAPPIACSPPKITACAASEASKPRTRAPGNSRRLTGAFLRRRRRNSLGKRDQRTEASPRDFPLLERASTNRTRRLRLSVLLGAHRKTAEAGLKNAAGLGVTYLRLLPRRPVLQSVIRDRPNIEPKKQTCPSSTALAL